MKKIKNAAVRCIARSEKDSNNYLIGEGFDHNACYNYLGEAYGCYPRLAPMRYICEEGFLLEDNSFVTRNDAFAIAKENNQLLPEYSHYQDVLNQGLKSYMIDWNK
jgi:hypothetical protein